MKAVWPAIALVAFGLAGCSQPSPVGKWDANIEAQGKQLPAVVEFKSDNTATWDISVPKQEMGPVSVESFHILASGTWKADGTKFSSTVTDLKLSDGAPDMIKSAFELGKKQITEQMNKARSATLAYKESGAMEMTTPDGVVTTYVKHKG
ncbi:MAG: hypothetical protein JSS65_03005 [Armatimonadetes bacterium]|nr:hypothetical protein [Armatimonadota bacterium]